MCWQANLQSDETDGWLKFGNVEYGSLSGYKWNDFNGDSIKQDTEPGLQGWSIQLRKDLVNKGLGMAYTDVNGNLIGINAQTGQQVYSRPGASLPQKATPVAKPGDYIEEDDKKPTGTPQTGSQVLSSPPFSMPAGTQGIEYPVGSGNYWDVGPDGRWM